MDKRHRAYRFKKASSRQQPAAGQQHAPTKVDKRVKGALFDRQ